MRLATIENSFDEKNENSFDLCDVQRSRNFLEKLGDMKTT